ncbi:hypothetical protein L3Q82_026611 [Scortum barcoo]|uniref:Uncharacterized protein n=1 Tax=Scortum barcoo TaxID=214431 RepID=A0ACB8WII6_9TELE|nr:hypothetical protein L3Q82_026611 [Scortum barcoo]
MNTMIRCLPPELQGRLRSGVAIPSLQQCVEELLLNSIDAGATCVGVRLDVEACKVQVADNGAGMDAEDMEYVGNRYYTSKCGSVEDLDNLRWYGFRGEALASAVSLSTLVEISSRTRSSVKTHVKIFRGGKGAGVFEAETSRPSAGTTVVICNFFHNMPVRRRRMDSVLEGERIRHRVEAVSLVHPSVSFTLRNDCTGAMMVQLPKARDTYHRFIQMHGLGRAQKLGEIGHKLGQFEVVGHVGREGHYNGSLQFLYVNQRLVLKTRIHKLLNLLLRRLTSSGQKNDSPDGQSATRSPKHKRSQELHGVYIIDIKCPYSEYDICLEPAKTLIEFKDWDGVLLCIEEAVKAFLSRENLVAVLSQDDLDSESPRLFGTRDTDEEGHNSSGDGGQAASSDAALYCSVGMKLASAPVHRKCKDDGTCEESVCQECTEETVQLGQRKVKANELEKKNSEGGINRQHRDELLCDPAGLDAVSDNNNITVEEESSFSEAEEGSQMLCTSRHLESEQLELSKERVVQLRNKTSASSVISLNSIAPQAQADLNSNEQLLPDCLGVGGHGQTSVSNRKISLSDPYIHESLQKKDLSQTSQSLFHLQISSQKCAETSFALKRKISLDACPSRSVQKLCKDLAPVVPSKIPRTVTEKLSLCQKSGSLEKFRRAYGKSDELKLPFHKNPQENNTGLPQTDRFALDSQNILVFQKTQKYGDVTETQKEETQSDFQSPPTLSVFTKLKPVSVQNRGKTSLAAKLCHLKQHIADNSKVSRHLSRTTSQDCLSGGNDGAHHSNNNENHGDTSPDPKPVPSCSTNPRSAETEQSATSDDWLHHYDTSVGKTVYVNKVTGLSRYKDPPTEETQVRCTSDVSNMAVSVISETDDENCNSLTSLYSKWNNPVFVRPPMVIHQVDKKFLACLIDTRDEETATLSETEGNLLVLVDQHAAHERVRLENLVADSYEDDPDAPGERRLCSSNILPPLEISITEEELRLLRSCQQHLRSLGLEVTFSQAADPQVFVGKVPLCFIEKESNELRRGRPSIIKPIVEEYLREQTELLRSTGRVKGTLPLTVLKVLASLACHGAIKFNDSLSRDECHSLVASLSSCQLPFQCAHGRPSIAPLVDILHLDKDQQELQKPNLQRLRRMYKAWELYGNR